MSQSSQSNAIVLAPDQIASNKLALSLGLEREAMLTTIKAQCFRNMNPDHVSNAMLATFVQVAQTLEINPLLPGMLYAYPERNGGITPIIGPDGVFKLLASRPDILGWSTRHETIDGDKACTAIIKHKTLGEITKTVFLSEWRVQNNPNWATRPRHMLEIRAIKQCARQIIHGIPMDEGERGFIDLDDPASLPGATAAAGVTIAGAGSTSTTTEAGTTSGDGAGTATPATKRASVPGKKPRGAGALAPAEPKNVTGTAAGEPAVGTASPEGAAPTAPATEEAKPAETAKPAVPVEIAAEIVDEKPKAAAAAPAVETPAAAEQTYKPRYDQPEGWPKTIEAFVCGVKPVKATYTKRDGTVVKDGEVSIVTLGGEDITKGAVFGTDPKTGSPISKVLFDPENAELLKVAVVSQALMSLTIEVWPSQSKPGQSSLVAVLHEDVPTI